MHCYVILGALATLDISQNFVTNFQCELFHQKFVPPKFLVKLPTIYNILYWVIPSVIISLYNCAKLAHHTIVNKLIN